MSQFEKLTISLIFKLFLFDLKSNYKNSKLKYLWDFAPNIASAIVWVLIFKLGFLRFGETIENYHIFILQGLFLWQFVVDIVNKPVAKTIQYTSIIKNNSITVLTPFYIALLESLYLLAGKLLILLIALIFTSTFSFSNFLFSIFLSVPLLVFSSILSYLTLPFLLSSKDIFGGQKMFFSLFFYVSSIVFPIPFVYEKFMVYNPIYLFINLSKNQLNNNINTNYLACTIYLIISLSIFLIFKKKNDLILQKVSEIL